MHRLTYILLFLGLCGPLNAAKCDTDVVPAATLLYPYFEVDLADTGGKTTLLSITNRDSAPVLVNVTLWTDWAIATESFEIYLAGYDMQTLNLRDIFIFGRVPQTGSAVSSHGALSEPPVEFPGCNDTTTPGEAPVYSDPALGEIERGRLQAYHKGECFEGMRAGGSVAFSEQIVRGYITVDAVDQCSGMTPADAGYFGVGGSGVASDRNVLMGDYFLVKPGENFAQGEQAVHIEAFPGAFSAGDYTFYKRFVDGTAIDDREPLGTQYQARHLLGGAFDGGTELIVWRDPGSPEADPVACGDSPGWYKGFISGLPSYRVIFDEQGNAVEDPGPSDNTFPPDSPRYRIPLATQALDLPLGGDPSSGHGATYLVLRHADEEDPADWEVLQGWVATIYSAENRFSVGQRAIRLDSACDPGPIKPAPSDFE